MNALFVGAFDKPKRLPFLFEAADLVHKSLPDFVLVLAGAGPEDGFVRHAAKSRSYVRLVGRLELDELARFANVVDILLMPGRVGLVAVDALALGLPLATTRYPHHAPEVDYLNEQNSLWTDDSTRGFADGVTALLSDPPRLASLAARARADGKNFSVEQTAQIFVTGILAGLGGSK
jgi:glycosyltransferase involved in cell wall biosynthesis